MLDCVRLRLETASPNALNFHVNSVNSSGQILFQDFGRLRSKIVVIDLPLACLVCLV